MGKEEVAGGVEAGSNLGLVEGDVRFAMVDRDGLVAADGDVGLGVEGARV